ncbi:hypothetical protein P168DRAFT_262654 [Aspergillus campestris IBT 28561]|uniref:Uncharacterized protein n=1 Tax=Aspergillus campestris (strain IBT 28561) TaxID=1392248 RepID=A0A2I1DEM3_ASPC2|nr:uncharacterized protein P168DRAFT_262654 [Aspergillus campestris IBT 28561]PKY08318.1 hypothetical protein P168DRAFT_262654 [Aspergillus campestris IBT 28561]
MHSTTNAYASEPAVPLLAHSLLQHDVATAGDQQNTESTPTNPSLSNRDWNLEHDIKNGVEYPSMGVFRLGTVIGFSFMKNDSKEGDDLDHVGQIPRYLLAARLQQSAQCSNTNPSAFIIYPAHFDAFSPEKLLESLLSASQSPTLSRSEAISRLDSVQLIPVFDFSAASQALHQIADSLSQQRQQPDHSITLIFAGLDSLTEGVIRASNAVRGAAVLTSVLRTLTQLSRTHSMYLSIMLVNTGGLGQLSPFYNPRPSTDDSQHHPAADDGSIHSIFRTSGAPLFPNLLAKTLDHGIDTHLLLSVVRGQARVVEVIKDRVGDGVGKWCVWRGELS